MMTSRIEADDVQALVFRGHGDFPHSGATGFTLVDAAQARARLLELVREQVCFGPRRLAPDRPRVQLLFSAEGLRRLGAAAQGLLDFHRPFGLGMTAPQTTRTLGDAGRNRPDQWLWNDGQGQVLALVYGPTAQAVRDASDRLARDLAPGCLRGYQLATHLPADEREPFGFRDGLAKTYVRIGDGDSPKLSGDVIAPGEVVLGYRNAAEESVLTPPLFRNGSFVVLRQLQQDVREFWKFWLEQAGGDEERAVWLAAKALGRWPNGMPMESDAPGPEPALDEAQAQKPLSFRGDPRGAKCPFGAHVRRANPRDGLAGGAERSSAIAALHRMLRRGRAYGPVPPPEWYPRSVRRTHPDLGAPSDTSERGLLFMCLCGDIDRQFEFVQQSWLNHPKHADLYNESDPIAAGDAVAGSGGFFSIPRAEGPRRRVAGVTGWVTVRGGGYYLMPGKRALLGLLAPADAQG